jgi:3-phenylpropionate/cinnamic acid dioxygenase small subunit
LQAFFLSFLKPYEDECCFEVLPEQRLQINARRYRVQDVMLVSFPNRDERIVRTALMLCIEILSSEDRMRKVQERLND